MPRRARPAVDLREIRLFADLSDTAIVSLEPAVSLRQVPKAQVLYLENERCRAFYAVRTGAAKIYKLAPDGREFVLMVAGAGDTFAEEAAVDGGVYGANAETIEDSEVYEIGADWFREVVHREPEVALAVLRGMTARVRAYSRQLEDLTFRTVDARVAEYLLELARAEGDRRPDGIHVQLHVSQQALAAHLGTVRELVSRSLRKLEAAALITHKGKHVVVLNEDGLAGYV